MAKGLVIGATVAAPSLGPAVVTVLGIEVPILALIVSFLSLVLVRLLPPPDTLKIRSLTRLQEGALTLLLGIILFLGVVGEITGEPLSVGMSVAWAIGLGSSGMLVVEIFAGPVRRTLSVWLGNKEN